MTDPDDTSPDDLLRKFVRALAAHALERDLGARAKDRFDRLDDPTGAAPASLGRQRSRHRGDRHRSGPPPFATSL